MSVSVDGDGDVNVAVGDCDLVDDGHVAVAVAVNLHDSVHVDAHVS